ncbi:MAG: GDP-mannose 4,6-dehydratase [Anaerolineaceae bacterium]|nr:GDP-mannose 4,6-dehydratase [Anaerolineaceae bacterium]
MRILITGASGFAGRHLIEHILNTVPDAVIHGTVFGPNTGALPESGKWYDLDLRDVSAVCDLIAQIRPEQIYHLAAQASPRRSFEAPWETLENNIRAQLNLILGCLAADLEPRMVIISSAEIYRPVDPPDRPIPEDTPFLPTSPYGVSKITQDMLAKQYFLSHQLPIMLARPFNHCGPGQSLGFVAPDFAIQIARIEAGQQQPVIQVGNLSARRDFTDVRDVVRAYRLIMAHGKPGEAYNVASGQAYSIQELLDTLIGYSTTPVEVRVDPARFLPVDVPIKRGDASKLGAAAGWMPEIPLHKSLLDILNDCRQRVRAGGTS